MLTVRSIKGGIADLYTEPRRGSALGWRHAPRRGSGKGHRYRLCASRSWASVQRKTPAEWRTNRGFAGGTFADYRNCFRGIVRL